MYNKKFVASFIGTISFPILHFFSRVINRWNNLTRVEPLVSSFKIYLHSTYDREIDFLLAISLYNMAYNFAAVKPVSLETSQCTYVATSGKNHSIHPIRPI